MGKAFNFNSEESDETKLLNSHMGIDVISIIKDKQQTGRNYLQCKG